MPADVLFKILDTVDSTNNYAMGQLHAGLATHGMAWHAREQTAGKGQRGKSWQTGQDQNIAMSLIIEPVRLKTEQQFYLSMVVALAAQGFFAKYAGNEVKIKWPNDLYWRDRKAGGILIENIFHGREWKWAVVGIGINVNQDFFDQSLKNPVSLAQISGRTFNTEALARELHQKLMEKIAELYSRPIEALLAEYNALLYKMNELVRLKKGTAVFETTIKNVTSLGILHTKDAIERQFNFGEVEWVL
jgi:BirA family biotin operon repressor/biotin-[acetyl-CoA-carboxylase] ligase